ncbi:sugar transferase [Kocuria sp. M1R5S2]|uniref:sugar transferase n=1 Tax=Kocuria rhizosphaerae TaxID=3376285 RepID=UPI0037992D2C
MLKVDQIARAENAEVEEFPRLTEELVPRSLGGWRKSYVRLMLTSDALALVLTLAATQLIRFQLENAGLHLGAVSVPYWAVGVALALAWWVHLGLSGTRDVRLIGYGLEETREVVSSTLVLFGTVALFSFALNIPTARSYVLIALPLGLCLLVLGRFAVRHRLAKSRQAGRSMSRTLVVGRMRGVAELVDSLRGNPMAGFATTAVYAPPSKYPLPRDLEHVQLPPNGLSLHDRPSVEGVMEVCHQLGIETVIMSSNVPLSTREIRHLSWQLTDQHIRLVMETGLTDIAGPRIHMQQVAGLPLIHVATPRLSRSRALTKRLMDIVLSAAALLVLSPVLVALALVVRTHDGGPAFFAQERVGQDGSRFKMLKFRSMRTDAEQVRELLEGQNEGHGLLFKLKEDPRITGPGTWMRRYSLDELPQFLNVLKGDMSIVGPRPPLPSEVDLYEDYVHRRMRVKPGITGLWQVSGRSDLNWDQSVRLDLYYVENWSPVQDVLIMVRTLKAVLAKEGAY